MVIFFRSLSTILFMTLLSSCQWITDFTMGPDLVVADLEKDIKMLEEELKVVKDQTFKIREGLNDPEIDPELKDSMKKEVFEADFWENKMFEMIAYRKVQLRQRKDLLKDRKKEGAYSKEVAKKESDEYFLKKKLYPIKKGWNDRYRAAIDL